MNFATELTKITNTSKYTVQAMQIMAYIIKTCLNKDTLNRERDSMSSIILYSVLCVAVYMMNKACLYIILK